MLAWVPWVVGVLVGLVAFPVLALLLVYLRRVFTAPSRRQGALHARYGGWAVVTGASAGLGTSLALQLALDGFHVVLVARRRERLEELAKTIRTRFPDREVRVVECDLSKPGGPKALLEACQDLDVGVLVNNAGKGHFGHVEDMDVAEIEGLTQLNFVSPVVLARLFAPALMQRAKRSAVLTVSSTAAYTPCPFAAVYGGLKMGVSSTMAAMHEEQRARNTRLDVCTFEPGGMATEFGDHSNSGVSFKKFMSADTAASRALDGLAGQRSTFVAAHGDFMQTFLASRVLSETAVCRALYRRFTERRV